MATDEDFRGFFAQHYERLCRLGFLLAGDPAQAPADPGRPPAGGLCPRCGSPDHLPVVYGRLAEREALSRKYPEGFVAGGCYVESVEDRGPDRCCRRCGRRFRSGGARRDLAWGGRPGRPSALSPTGLRRA
jgi:hypothetical protein